MARRWRLVPLYFIYAWHWRREVKGTGEGFPSFADFCATYERIAREEGMM